MLCDTGGGGLNVVGWGKRWDTSYTAQTHIHRH